MTRTINWGILATGGITHTFVRDLAHVKDARLVAVGSRTQEKADEFAARHGIPRAYGTYEELANAPEVDIVYVATPHPMHKENVMACLQAGKAVLCEKSFVMNAQELEVLMAAAREHRLFLMEAMWTRFLPAIRKVREWLSAGVIGDVRMVDVRFGNRATWNPESRLFKPELGGGALLDVGIYCVSFISMVLGQSPTSTQSLVNEGETGVDEVFTALLGYPDGRMASVMAGLRLKSRHEAVILGTEGEIRVADFWKAKSAVLTVYNQYEERFEDKGEPIGYAYEAAEAVRCMQAGQLESSVMPLDESLAIMKTMDRLRAGWGLTYPGE